MANYFSERNELENKIRDLTIALNSLHDAKKDARQNYLSELARLIKSRPDLTASQYAMLLSDNACERNSIRTSIGNMGYVAEHHRKFVTGKLGNWESDLTPTLPALKRKEITIKRRFIEVDENNQPIGTHEYEEFKYTYSMEG
jgi:hypothetical protein